MFDWAGITSRIGNIVLDVKQTQDKNKLIGFAVLGLIAILLLVSVFALRRK